MDIQRIAIGGIAALTLFALYGNQYYPNGPGTRPAPQASIHVGQDMEAAITLVTSDARDLACAGAKDVGGRHCEFSSAAQNQKWTQPSTTGRPPAQDLLAPYKTTDDTLFLIPGLWLEPALAHRLAIDPPNSPEHIRFVATCKLHVEGEMEDFDVRWHRQGQWQHQQKAFIGTISGCVLSEG